MMTVINRKQSHLKHYFLLHYAPPAQQHQIITTGITKQFDVKKTLAMTLIVEKDQDFFF